MTTVAYHEVHLFPTTVPDPTCTSAAPCAECRAFEAEHRVECCGARREEPHAPWCLIEGEEGEPDA